MVRQYIGARYVTKIYENSNDPSSAEWEASVNYEPITMVTYNNGSYLSKKEVPASIGNPAANPAYWVQTGFYNGQIAYLQAQIDNIELLTGEFVTPQMYGAVGDGVTDDTVAFQTAIDSGKTVIVPVGDYIVSGLILKGGISFISFGNIETNDYLFKIYGSRNSLKLYGECVSTGDYGIIFDTSTAYGITTHDISFNTVEASSIICQNKYGIYMFAPDYGIYSNRIEIDHLIWRDSSYTPESDVTSANAVFGIYIESTGDGYINENSFGKSHVERWTSSITIVNKSSHSTNNNVFNNISPESSKHALYLRGETSAIWANCFENIRNEEVLDESVIVYGKIDSNHFTFSAPIKAATFKSIGNLNADRNVIYNGLSSSSGGILWEGTTIFDTGADGEISLYPEKQNLGSAIYEVNSAGTITFDLSEATASNFHQYGTLVVPANVGVVDVYLSNSFANTKINAFLFIVRANSTINIHIPVRKSGGSVVYRQIKTLSTPGSYKMVLVRKTNSNDTNDMAYFYQLSEV